MATVGETYLAGRGGSISEYHIALRSGKQVLGTAFFNALSGRDQDRIRGTKFDPRHKEGSSAVEKTVEFLLDTE